ncbi:alpha-1,3-mannosyl-glycoprotein 2-beta-N-acetylglucosaminyltransferase-like isoform X2 [Pomacea canaliculata]|uniref:alpha-1,3-mannosyl-glycoprotein 2-beta-N-acetylglucosaminyltransferase-like isoform X2 n=1 Tax=Pomacea canaliculata TaxID=400727 RepID=UPI000D727161|nr:alpha-1,3-mannosyl-glycoprotein 2-beta-N-acetylglucosaminyltransferase-like isoform X2 [Pomacea canaliculata]
MPRIKHVHLFLLVVGVFLVWNIVTYYTLVNKSNAKEQSVEKLLEVRLSKLQARISAQLEQNKQLLQQLQGQIKNDNAVTQETVKKEITNERDKIEDDTVTEWPEAKVIPVLMIACDRPTVSRSLDKLLEHRPSAEKFPIIVSQDCGHQETANIIQSYVTNKNISGIAHIKHPDLSDIKLDWPQKKFSGYYKIARHYKWALNQVFNVFNFSAVIIVEDDLDIAPDFFEYFSATYKLLHSDPLLWCVSAWNDNGKAELISDKEAEKLYRTDFFPGLGWMIERKIWMELESKWPQTFWDDWMRHPEQRRNRECIRPEVCRTSTFGKKGVSKGLYFDLHLRFIHLNSKYVPFTSMDLSYLQKEQYDSDFVKTVYEAPPLSAEEVFGGLHPEESAVRVQYTTKDDFKRIAKMLGIMDDFKAGVPRAAYRGVVSFMFRGRRVYVAPPSDWTGYDTTWT